MSALPVFSSAEFEQVKRLLANQVALMMGRKFEEGDWSGVYCAAKALPQQTWSNLHIDVMYGGLGVEHKMLCVANNRLPLKSLLGTTLMHPSATRSIRVNADLSANDAMEDVLGQYGDLIEARRVRVAEASLAGRADMRTGWLIWETSLTEFLYFEEAMTPPVLSDFRAEWNVRVARGARKATKNLWVYEKATGKKRYSITTSAGPKIQPYFDIPSGDPNVYLFRVQSEELANGLVRIWVSAPTSRELERSVGDLGTDVVSSAILEISEHPTETPQVANAECTLAIPVDITAQAHDALCRRWQGVSDEHRIQLFLQSLTARR